MIYCEDLRDIQVTSLRSRQAWCDLLLGGETEKWAPWSLATGDRTQVVV